jgi:hypothetical protein
MQFHPNNCSNSYSVGEQVLVEIFGDFGNIHHLYILRWISSDGKTALGELVNKDKYTLPDEEFLIFNKDNSIKGSNYYHIIDYNLATETK